MVSTASILKAIKSGVVITSDALGIINDRVRLNLKLEPAQVVLARAGLRLHCGIRHDCDGLDVAWASPKSFAQHQTSCAKSLTTYVYMMVKRRMELRISSIFRFQNDHIMTV